MLLLAFMEVVVVAAAEIASSTSSVDMDLVVVVFHSVFAFRVSNPSVIIIISALATANPSS